MADTHEPLHGMRQRICFARGLLRRRHSDQARRPLDAHLGAGPSHAADTVRGVTRDPPFCPSLMARPLVRSAWMRRCAGHRTVPDTHRTCASCGRVGALVIGTGLTQLPRIMCFHLYRFTDTGTVRARTHRARTRGGGGGGRRWRADHGRQRPCDAAAWTSTEGALAAECPARDDVCELVHRRLPRARAALRCVVFPSRARHPAGEVLTGCHAAFPSLSPRACGLQSCLA